VNEPRELHRRTTVATSAVMVVLGIAMLVSTLARGGGPLALGVVLGLLFVAAGAGRIHVGRRR
jgi:dipeptide/tripeptide permease